MPEETDRTDMIKKIIYSLIPPGEWKPVVIPLNNIAIRVRSVIVKKPLSGVLRKTVLVDWIK